MPLTAGESVRDALSHPKGVLRAGTLQTVPTSTPYLPRLPSHREAARRQATEKRRRHAEDGGALDDVALILLRKVGASGHRPPRLAREVMSRGRTARGPAPGQRRRSDPGHCQVARI